MTGRDIGAADVAGYCLDAEVERLAVRQIRRQAEDGRFYIEACLDESLNKRAREMAYLKRRIELEWGYVEFCQAFASLIEERGLP